MRFVCVCLANVILIVVSSNIASVMSSLTDPKSSVVLIGEKVEMKCSVNGNDSTTWTYTAWNSSTVTNIYLGEYVVTTMRSRYKIDKNISGEHNLIIDSVDFTYAGRYRCTAAIQKTLWNDIQLTVLGSQPDCAANISEAQDGGKVQIHLTIWCIISYMRNVKPVFSWTTINAEKTIAANTTTSHTNNGSLINTSSTVEQLNITYNGVTFHCHITFEMPNNSQGVHVYTWNYTLPYGPRNLRIVEHEDRLECSADGNPTPIYRWTDVETNISTNGYVYILNRTNDIEHTLECTAINAFAAKSKNFTIKGPATQVVSNFPLKALAIGGGFLLVIAIIVWCVVQRKRLKGASRNRPDVALNTDLTSHGYDGRMIADNAVYAEVRKPKGPSKGNKGANIGVNSRPPQTANREKKIVTGADGTVYAELSGVKPPARKGEVPKVSKSPAFSQVEIYAAIDHSGKVPAPPLLQK